MRKLLKIFADTIRSASGSSSGVGNVATLTVQRGRSERKVSVKVVDVPRIAE